MAPPTLRAPSVGTDLGAECLEHGQSFGGGVLGNDRHEPVAPEAADHRECDAGVPRRGLDDCVTGRDQAATFGRIEHGLRDAILARARGVGRLELREQSNTGVWSQPRELHQRRVADHPKDVGVSRRRAM